MFSIAYEILFLLLLIGINGLFAMSEIAIVSARKIRLERLSAKGDQQAKVALKLANNPNQVLSTVQIGITLSGIFAGAFGGANIANRLGNLFQELYIFPQQSDAIALGIVVLIITYLSLVLGELVPKRLGLSHPEPIACGIALPLRNLSRLTAPIVYFLSISTDFILKLLFSQQEDTNPAVTRTEIEVLVEQGKEAGTIEAIEQDMMQGVLQLKDQEITALMTPASDLIFWNPDHSLTNNHQKLTSHYKADFVICQDANQQILGILPVRDALSAILPGDAFNLKELLQHPLFVPENTKGVKMLQLFRETQSETALVIDESGEIQGLATLHQILEAVIC